MRIWSPDVEKSVGVWNMILVKETTVETWAYHVPTADVRLFNPQSYFRRYNKHGKMSVDANFVGLYGPRRTPSIRIPYHQANNMTMLFDVVGQRSAPITMHSTPYANRMCTSVHGEINPSLTASQEELLIFHQWYGHTNMQWFQYLMRNKKYKTEGGKIISEIPVIVSKNPAARSCKTPNVRRFSAE